MDEPLTKAVVLAPDVGMSVRQMHRLAKDGVLPHYRFGRSVRFRRSEVLAWSRVEARAAPTSTPASDEPASRAESERQPRASSGGLDRAKLKKELYG